MSKWRDYNSKGETHKKSQWLALKMPTALNSYYPKKQDRSVWSPPWLTSHYSRLIVSNSNLKDQQQNSLKYRIYSNKDQLGHLSPNLWNQEASLTSMFIGPTLCVPKVGHHLPLVAQRGLALGPVNVAAWEKAQCSKSLIIWYSLHVSVATWILLQLLTCRWHVLVHKLTSLYILTMSHLHEFSNERKTMNFLLLHCNHSPTEWTLWDN